MNHSCRLASLFLVVTVLVTVTETATAQLSVQTNKIELGDGLQLTNSETNIKFWIKSANDDFGHGWKDTWIALREKLPFTAVDSNRLTRKEALSNILNWAKAFTLPDTTNFAVPALVFPSKVPVDLFVVAVEANSTNACSFRLRNGEEVSALYRASNVQFVVMSLSPPDIQVHAALSVVLSDTEKLKKKQQETFVSALLSLGIGGTPISSKSVANGLVEQRQTALSQLRIYQGQYTPQILPSRIASELKLSYIPDAAIAEAVSNQQNRIKTIKNDIKTSVNKYLDTTPTTSEDGEQRAKIVEINNARLKLANDALNETISKDGRSLSIRTKEADVGRPSQWSFGLAYSVSKSDDVEYSIENGTINSKTDTKNPIFLTANWDWWKTDFGLDALDDLPPMIETSLMIGFRTDIDQIEPLLGVGAGFRLPWADIALRLWGGAAYVTKGELQGDAKAGQEVDDTTKIDTNREFQWLWGFAADWRI